MNEFIKVHLISLGFEEVSLNYFIKNDISVVYAEGAYHLSFYLKPMGDITLVDRIREDRIYESRINNFIEVVDYIKNKLY
jgi:hypothetical protein